MEQKSHLVIAYYFFTSIKDPMEEVLLHKKFFQDRDVMSRIYISNEGINAQMSATREAAHEYMEWMHSRPEFKDIDFKLHEHREHAFPRKTVKVKKKLVAIDEEINLENRGELVSPKIWKEMLENEKKKVVLDIRNDYEWKIGHFEGAELPKCETFREFKDYADNLKETVDPKKTPVMMYCTGGIRCELFSDILKDKGFEKVYQLQGGVIKYGLEQKNEHWLGKLFVFDDRLAVPLNEEDGAPIIGECHHCKKPNDRYFNCANVDCNELFLCCPECLQKFLGCCCSECKTAKRVRPFKEVNTPFRRWTSYSDETCEV